MPETTLSVALPYLLVVLIGLVIIYGARRRWRWLVDPPEWLYLVYSQSFLKVLLGRQFVLYFTYFMGMLFALVGAMAGYIALTCESSPISGVTANTVKQMQPLSPAQTHLETLLSTLIYYLNALFLSVLLLIGMRMKWFLKGEPPQWIRSIFENNKVVRFLYIICGIIAFYSAAMAAPYIRELGHGLGYW
jgi:hypothetical protein